MDDFKNFLKENNYENDLEFQLCDLEMAFNAGRKLQWKPSDEQMNLLEELVEDNSQRYFYTILRSLYEQLKKLREE